MAAELGNDYAVKLKDKETKDKVYKDYCQWIASGKNHKAWRYKSDDLTLSYKCIEHYIATDKDFPLIHKEIAISESLEIWEERGIGMMLGQIDKCQPAIFQMFMRNKFGWDSKTEDPSISKNEGTLEKIASNLEQDVKNQCPNLV